MGWLTTFLVTWLIEAPVCVAVLARRVQRRRDVVILVTLLHGGTQPLFWMLLPRQAEGLTWPLLGAAAVLVTECVVLAAAFRAPGILAGVCSNLAAGAVVFGVGLLPMRLWPRQLDASNTVLPPPVSERYFVRPEESPEAWCRGEGLSLTRSELSHADRTFSVELSPTEPRVEILGQPRVHLVGASGAARLWRGPAADSWDLMRTNRPKWWEWDPVEVTGPLTIEGRFERLRDTPVSLQVEWWGRCSGEGRGTANPLAVQPTGSKR